MATVCSCVGVQFQNYDATVSMKTPEGRWVAIDVCIATEIGRLWMRGVVTLGSCCGHGQMTPHVIVTAESVPKMRELGYDQWRFPGRAEDLGDDIFALTGKAVPVLAGNVYYQAWQRELAARGG